MVYVNNHKELYCVLKAILMPYFKCINFRAIWMSQLLGMIPLSEETGLNFKMNYYQLDEVFAIRHFYAANRERFRTGTDGDVNV